MPSAEATEQTVIIVVQVEAAGRPLTMGVLVDLVLEVLDIKPDAIEPSPDLGSAGAESDFIMGVGKAGKHVVFLLDIARVLSGHELHGLQHPADAQA